jgi:hypothetical protein
LKHERGVNSDLLSENADENRGKLASRAGASNIKVDVITRNGAQVHRLSSLQCATQTVFCWPPPKSKRPATASGHRGSFGNWLV